ncbi:cellulase family glycosylhydrolase [Streptacidiphilus rugosus]|uniref:cellulase family glycosylhydrolase n=1 Tax=Streptacidiphilus rugosus TaxID=405783 RepID=UPI000AE9252B|nr:cellulase family glycosylhydrolase [Streptacidiphilus rugosus]
MSEQSPRRQRLVVALVALLVTATATVAGVRAASPPKSGTPHTTWAAPQAPPPTAGRLAFGVSYGDTLLFDNDHNLAQGLDDAVALGVRWIRLDLSWEDIQPDTPTGYQWNRFDRVVNAARARGLNLLPTIAYTPSWARSSGCRAGQSCPPANPETFADFAAQAVERYSPKGITTWEIWNEPNIKPFWEPKPDPAAYTRLLAVTTKAIRHVNPRAYLLMGGLAAVGTDKSTGYVSQTAFLAAVSELGANKMVDAISYHPYTYPYLPTDDTTFGTAFQRISTYTSDNLVAILEKYGTPREPVWITETGAPTNGPGAAADGKTIPPNATDVTEAFQAQIATASVTAAANNPHVAAMFWFADRDSGTAADRAFRSKFYGLRHNNGTAKPAFAALQSAIAEYERTRHG